MTYEQDKAMQAQLNAVKVAAKKESDAFVAQVRKVYEDEQARLKALLAEADGEIAGLEAKIVELNELGKLKANLYAFSDTFHLAAKRIIDTENPEEEAKTLKALADQLLTVVGLPVRPESEFA